MGEILDAMVELQKHVLKSAGQNPGIKPLVVALSSEGQVRDTQKHERQLNELGVPAYGSLQSACRALYRAADYYNFLAESKT
jgi:acyl-CoA synthetase (NDP forming)